MNEYIFDDYIDDINLNDELKHFYKLIDDDELKQTFEANIDLTNLRNDNYKRYNEIDISKIENLSKQFEEIVQQTKKIYSFINPTTLLLDNLEDSINNSKIINQIYEYYDRIEKLVLTELNKLEQENNIRQDRIKKYEYSNINKNILQEISNKYNEIVIYNATIEDNILDNYKRQIKRKKYIDELYKLLNIEIDLVSSELNEKYRINNDIKIEIEKIYNRISYIEDLMIEKSKYENDLNIFTEYFNSLIAYDDNEYSDLYRVHNILCKEGKIDSLLAYFEEELIKEREQIKKEEEFIYNKYGIKNIKTSLDYISANYVTELTEEEKNIINELYNQINNEFCDITQIYNRLKLIVKNIWKKELTNVSSYDNKEEFSFICTNNQFLDEKHESILITSKMLERVSDYSDYQIGFVCDFNENILYITENHDIMSIDYNDMSNLKTPKQIEQEFLNFKVCNRIALNGYITKLSAVYYIDDGNFKKYKKAVELANQYNLPLIQLKKNKI